MKHTFKALLIICLLITSIKASADDHKASNNNYTLDTNSLLKLFSDPASNVQPSKDTTFMDFVIKLQHHSYSRTQLFEVQRVYRSAVSFYKKRFEATPKESFVTREKILGEMQKLTLAMMAYLEANRIADTTVKADADRFIMQKLTEQDAYNRQEMTPAKRSEENIEKSLVTQVGFAVDKILNRGSPAEFLYFHETTLALTAEIMPVKMSVGNVAYLASKSEEKKAFRLDVIEPDAESGRAMAIATQALLQNKIVPAVLFEDRLRIPTKLDSSLYEMKAYGDGILLRAAPAMCARLFN